MSSKLLFLGTCLTGALASAGEISGTVSGVTDLENVIVYVENAPGPFSPPAALAVMDQHNMRFVPHVLPVLSGTTVDFPNSDTVRHNVFSPSRAKKFNLGIYPRGMSKKQVMDIPGAQVVSLLCAIHAQLAAFVLVLQNPYFVIPDKDGSFTLRGVPPGSYTLIAWHEKQADLPRQKVTVGAAGAKAGVALFFAADLGHSGT